MSAPPSEVVERLDRLAEHAPRATIDPDAVWARGRRRQGRRWVAATVCAAVLAGVGAAAASPLVRWVDPPVATDPEGTGMVLPELIRRPGKWEPVFEDAPGPLSVVGFGTRGGWTSDHSSLWGVSALTGETRFLDLPSVAPRTLDVSLSDDGTRLAYLTSTGPAGEPAVAGESRVATGVAILDLTTGEERRWDAGTTHGLDPGGMVWTGDVLRFRGGVFTGAEQESAVQSSWVWGPTGEPAVETASPWARGADEMSSGAGRVVVASGGSVRAVRVLDAGGAVTALRLVHDSKTSSVAVSPDGSRVVGLEQKPLVGSVGAPLPLLGGEVDAGRAVMERLGGVVAVSVLGWRSPTEVVVSSSSVGSDGEPTEAIQISTADVTDGSFTRLLDSSASTPITVAADAWAGEVVAVPAPFAPDPRLVGLLVAAALVLVAALWRTVRRRRGHP